MTNPSPDRPAPEAPPALSPREPSAAGSLGAWLRFGIPAVFGTAADLWSKSWAFPTRIDPTSDLNGRFAHDPTPAIPHLLTFETVVNHGGVFGQLQGWVPFLAAFSWLAVALIVYAFLRTRRRQIFVQLALGLIMAGAIGNLYDRTVYGVVRDFMRFNVSWYPYVFNVADVLLCIGVPLLLICWTFTPDPEKQAAARKDVAPAAGHASR